MGLYPHESLPKGPVLSRDLSKADPEYKKKGHDSKYQKGKKGDADKSGVRKNRSRRDIKSRDLSQHELRERRRTRSPDRKPNRNRINTPPSSAPLRQPKPRKFFLVDPPKPIKRNVAPVLTTPVVETKSKKKVKPLVQETVEAERPSVPEINYGKKIWGFVNRQAFHTPFNRPEPGFSQSTPPPKIKKPKFKRHKQFKEPEDLPQTELKPHKSKNKTVFESSNESSTTSGSSSERHGNFAKRFLRKQVWAVSKPYIKRNQRLSKLLEESKVNIDKIKINALDLDVINVDALGIKNKALKKSVIWLLK